VPPTSEQDEHSIHDAKEARDTPDSRLHLVLSVEWVSPSIARDRFRRWLRSHGWSPANVDELVLAVSEAVSNSIEHGYRVPPDQADNPVAHPSLIELDAKMSHEHDGRRVELTVTDSGRWMRPARERGSRGHGLTIIRACAEEVTINGGETGTTVSLRSRPVPPPL
jgi:anti-sigma regulatory factor (Ser/Thr protein kinase)